MANYYHETRKLLNTEYKFNYRGTADRYTHQMKTKNIISFVENTKSFVQYILFRMKTNEIKFLYCHNCDKSFPLQQMYYFCQKSAWYCKSFGSIQ